MQSWNIVITSPWQVVTAIVAVATAFTAIDKAWDTLLAKWKKHKAPEEAQNAEISTLKTQIQQIAPRLDAVEGQLTAMGKTVNDLHTGNLAVLHDRIYQMCRLCIKRGYITEDDLNNLKYLYDSYHSQGGNGTGTELYKRAKALISTTVPDGMYYEITYNGDKGEMYLDAYKKMHNECIKIEED